MAPIPGSSFAFPAAASSQTYAPGRLVDPATINPPPAKVAGDGDTGQCSLGIPVHRRGRQRQARHRRGHDEYATAAAGDHPGQRGPVVADELVSRTAQLSDADGDVRLGRDQGGQAAAEQGFWRGYSIVRLDPSGDPTKTVVEQRPVLVDLSAVAGDFNDWRSLLWPTFTNGFGFRCATDSKTGRRGAIATYPSFSPQGGLDRIYFRGPLRLLTVRRCRLQVSRVASDHLPVIADFEMA